ncbi:MAG: hypothetical protein DRO67_02805 [Candidatus Asgardarchaeum californiense]|nr:MAG: hypothetical protein DRO67_02805 [Candidatus Asgardarchaeum californiense]
MELHVYKKPDKKWDNFVNRNSPLIFHTRIWQRVLSKGFKNGQSLYYTLEDNSGEIVLALPGVLLNFRLFNVFYSLPASYGGFIGDYRYIKKFFSVWYDEIINEEIDYIQITESPFGPLSLNDFSYDVITTIVHIMRIENLTKDKLWKGYKKTVRRMIRKAKKSNVKISKISSREEVPIFYRMYLESMKRNRAPVKYPVDLYYAIYDELVLKNKAQILFAKIDGKYIAGLIYILSNGIIHYFAGGSFTKYLKLCPNDMLFHSAIEHGIENKCRYFDFMASPKDDTNLQRYKAKWGSKSLELSTYTKEINKKRCLIMKIARYVSNTTIGRKFIEHFRKMAR